MKIVFKKSALKDLSKFSKIEKNFIILKIETLSNFPDVANIKKLKNFYPPYRLRVGNYRILFEVIDEKIIIFAIKHRKYSYK